MVSQITDNLKVYHSLPIPNWMFLYTGIGLWPNRREPTAHLGSQKKQLYMSKRWFKWVKFHHNIFLPPVPLSYPLQHRALQTLPQGSLPRASFYTI